MPPFYSEFRDWHSAGPAPVAIGNERVQPELVADRPGCDDQHRCRDEDRDVASGFPPGPAHRRTHDEECEEQQPIVGFTSTPTPIITPLATQPGHTSIVTGRRRQQEEHGAEEQRDEDRLELEVAVVAIRSG